MNDRIRLSTPTPRGPGATASDRALSSLWSPVAAFFRGWPRSHSMSGYPQNGNGTDPDPDDQRNVLGGPLEPCSTEPRTGYLRDGCCSAVPSDAGAHHVCAAVTEEFLSFSRSRGNDLVTPRPALEFSGLEPGDRWCLCVGRWLEAVEAGVAVPVVLEATNEATLQRVDLALLREHALDTDP